MIIINKNTSILAKLKTLLAKVEFAAEPIIIKNFSPLSSRKTLKLLLLKYEINTH